MPVLPDSPECAALRANMREIVDFSIFMRINQLKLMGLCKKNLLSFRINIIRLRINQRQ